MTRYPTLDTQCQEFFEWMDGLVADAPDDQRTAHDVAVHHAQALTRLRLALDNDPTNSDLARAFDVTAERTRAACARHGAMCRTATEAEFDLGLRLIAGMQH